MQVIKNKRQLENIAKLFWDLSKICVSAFVIYPFIKDDFISIISLYGFLISILLVFIALYVDSKIKE
jgi:hypothetical protein